MVVHLPPPIKMGSFAEAPNVTDPCLVCPLCVLYDTRHKYNIAHLMQLKVVLSNIFNLPSSPPGAKTLLADGISTPKISNLRFAQPE